MQNLTGILRRINKVGARVVLTRLPGARAACRKDQEGYLIVVNEELSDDERAAAVLHELAHIELGHLDNDVLSEDDKENEVRKITSRRVRV